MSRTVDLLPDSALDLTDHAVVNPYPGMFMNGESFTRLHTDNLTAAAPAASTEM